MRPWSSRRRATVLAAGQAVLFVVLLLPGTVGAIPGPAPGAAPGAASRAVRLEVPEAVRLGGGSLGARRMFESEPIRVRLETAGAPRVVRLVVETSDPRWSRAVVTFTATGLRGCTGLSGALPWDIASPVLHTIPGATVAEAEVVLRISTPARPLGAGPRALHLRWELAEDPREPLAGELPGAKPSPGRPGLPRTPNAALPGGGGGRPRQRHEPPAAPTLPPP